jgi:uncharacterized spore protein YtfJ
MQTNWEEVLKRVTEFMENEARTETVVGKSFKLGEFECVPVIRLGLGFGSAGGEGDAPKQTHGEGGAAGAGIGMEPIGFLAVHKDRISFISTQSSKGLSAAFEKAPELIEKFLDQRVNSPEPVV